MTSLYGRDDALEQLSTPTNPVLLVTGDEGVGKSALLSTCRDTVKVSHLVGEQMTRLPHRSGGLQISILNQLISIVSELATRSSATAVLREKITSRISAVGSRRKEFAVVIAKELLTVVKERIGSDIGQALGEFFASASTDNSESILESLYTRVDTDALQAIVDIASDVASLKPGSALYLFFENAQNLSNEDLRQLADLPSLLPSNVFVRLEHQDSNDEHRQRIRLLRSGGVTEIPLTGLSEHVVASWCRDEDVPASLHTRVYASTRGYPLFVDDAIAQISANRRLGNISLGENFLENTLDSLNDLEPDDAAAARQLSAFIDPPPGDLIADILGGEMTTARWDGMQARLKRAKIFTPNSGGAPWFHEVRRRCIWESLSAPLRREAADRAVDFILSTFEETEDPELLVNLALIGSASSLVEQDPRAQYLSDAALDDIALLSALLEIAEPDAAGPSPEISTAFGDPVFDYCRQVFMEDVDAATALEKLASAQVIHVTENEHAAVLIPRLTKLAHLLALGRAGSELPRFPTTRIASFIFRTALSPRLEDFTTCAYGIGYPALPKAVADGDKTHKGACTRLQKPANRYVDAVLLRASIEKQPYYAFSTFSDAEKAMRSAAALQGAGGDYWGLHLDVDWVLQLPTGKIRSRRFLNALNRIHFEPRSDLPFLQEVTKKADLLRYIRANLTHLERAVLGLEESISYTVTEKEGSAMVVEVTGRGDGVTVLDPANYSDYRFSGPYRWATLRKALSLQVGEGTRNVTHGSTGGTYYQPKYILEKFERRAMEYNRYQPKPQVQASAEALQMALSVAVRDSFYDAQSLAAVLGQYGEVTLSPRKTLLLVHTHGEEGRRFGWRNSGAAFLNYPDPTLDHDTISVKVVEIEQPDFTNELFGTEFAGELAQIPDAAARRRDWRRYLGVSDVQYMISRELGYEDGEVGFFL
ncbi:AAA family ATPase [Streptomyces sp. NPDC058694]|uniref:AAA family ATPase n=1 Tax=Streptomyces sp. NPDC058694 TaxID=3346603 RepID=UPI0036630ECE